MSPFWGAAAGLLVMAGLLTYWIERRRRAAFEASLSPDELAGYRGFLAYNRAAPGTYGWRDAARQIRPSRSA